MLLLKHVLLSMTLSLSFVAQAKSLQIAIGSQLPPYVLEQMSAGMEVDIIREAFKVKGHTVSFQFVPNLRLLRKLLNEKLDGTAVNSSYDIAKEINMPIYNSDTTIIYHNFAIAFAYKNFQIQSVNDLVNKRVLGFQNAIKYLGSAYAAMAVNNDDYREHPIQSLQVKQLYAGRIDVVISEKRIFNYWKNHAESEGYLFRKNKNKKLKFHNIFEASHRNVKFVDRSTRDDFNQGLRIIKENGLYQAIIKKYENI